MKVFISWSGDAECEVAKALRGALHTVSAGSVEAFVSQVDIPRGDRGVVVIEDELTKTDYGIVLLSAANKEKPWINYEGGALATLLGRRVATVLLDLRTAEVNTPLAPFQATLFDQRESVLKLFTEIVQSATPKFPKQSIETLFAAEWEKIRESWKPDEHTEVRPRPQQEMLEEVVNSVRSLAKGQAILAHRLENTTSVQRLQRRSRITSPPASDFHEYLADQVRVMSEGLVWVERISRGNDGWRVHLGGHPNTTRAEFENAMAVVHGSLPDDTRAAVVMPLAPVDRDKGLLPDDTVEPMDQRTPSAD
jgi:hypothetical protein